MEEAFFENNRVDAVAMERLTASPGVISVYGLCGMTIVSEFAPKALADVVRDMNASQRLDLAVQVAQGVADVHSIDDRPSLSHNDLNLANLILTQDNRPVLNDFNVAVLLMKHNETGETCPFYSHFPNPQWKGPEEQVYSQVDLDGVPPVATEKVDIYALGNVLYRLAVGASPWKRPGAKRLTREEKDTVARLKRVNGTLPTIPDEVLQSTVPEVQTLLQAMRQCYQFNPKERPSAKEVVDFLRRSADGHRKDARQTAGP
jgi:serine/threonine protein kinase